MARINEQIQPDQYYPGFPYGQSGFVNSGDEKAQALAQINPHQAVMHWANKLCFQDKGDEVYNPNPYAYIPTNFQMISAIEAYNRNSPNEGPVYQQEPGMNNLLSGIQGKVQELLNNIRSATGTSQW